MNLLPKMLFPRTEDEREAELERMLMRNEAKIGGTLFGAVPPDRDRQFFCLDEHTWIWHESWQDNGRTKHVTTRYEMRPSGVLKAQTGKPYQRLTRDEARNLLRAIRLYNQRVSTYYQQLLAV